jgi:UDP-glucose 4-epimerase
MNKTRVLVTGAGGFIGKQVIEELTQRGFEVVFFDVIAPLNKNITRSYRGTILDPYEIAMAVRGCEYAVHLAAMLGVERTDKNRLECLYINIQGTINVLEACVKEGVKKVIFSSSSEVYGEQAVIPIKEDAPLNPKSVYAATKIVGEHYLKAYSETYPIRHNIVRFFNVYGENQREDFVMTRFFRAAMAGKAPQVFGTGKQARAFCHVSDAARGMVDVLLSQHDGEVFNIGNPAESTSMMDLARRVIATTGQKLEPQLVGYEQSDRLASREIDRRLPDIGKAQQKLGYKPTVSLDEGLKRMYAFFNQKA